MVIKSSYAKQVYLKFQLLMKAKMMKNKDFSCFQMLYLFY